MQIIAINHNYLELLQLLGRILIMFNSRLTLIGHMHLSPCLQQWRLIAIMTINFDWLQIIAINHNYWELLQLLGRIFIMFIIKLILIIVLPLYYWYLLWLLWLLSVLGSNDLDFSWNGWYKM